MQELLITYGLERTIYRISVSEYRDSKIIIPLTTGVMTKLAAGTDVLN